MPIILFVLQPNDKLDYENLLVVSALRRWSLHQKVNMSILPVLFAATYSMVANVNYDATQDAACKGDLYLPLHVKSTTPMVLVIHGGAWSSGARTDMNGVAELFVRDLGFAVFNIDYRLAGANSRWPACGDDCVTAANFVLSDEFKRQYGLAYDKLWIVGASAGGHLALWTHVNLPKDKVAGTMALSAIGDPVPDSAFAPSRYKTLFGTDAYDLDAMNPVKRISSGMAPVLMTHMTNDGVVPPASSKNFAAAYADAGNSVEYYEYERDEEPNEGGHCIWRKDSDPHKLIASIERRIAGFVKAAIPSGAEKVARDLRVVSVDVTRPGRVLPNTSQVLTVWNGVSADWSVPDNRDYPTRDFIEYVEMMSCTGGNAERDLFRNPADRSVLDDYDFTRLVTACRGILAHGAKPYLKLGNVPVKFTDDYDGGEFSMNIRPPADHLVHYLYMRACAAALKAAFGRDEVRTWRFAVLTEADNIGWFRAKSKDKAEIREAYFMLYDYAAQAFEEELGGGLVFGSHLLYPGDAKISQFSVEDFVAHCARGTNAATHRVGAPLRLLTVSYYGRPDGDDDSQGRCTEIRRVSEAVAQAGFTNVVMGVDEGRVMTATRGRNGCDLAARAVGQSYEAAFDVRVMREIVDAGQDYFATWGYFSGPDIRFAGVPSHHYFTSRELALFKGLRRLPASVSGPLPPKEELDAVAGVSVDGRTVRAVVGRFRDRLVFTNRLETAVAFRLPKAWAGRGVRVSVLTLDDRNNWFGDWQRDRVRHGIADNDFNWSPDSFSVMSGKGLREEAKRKVFESLQGAYSAKAASVRPNVRNLTVTADGLLTVPIDFAGNGASFISFLH